MVGREGFRGRGAGGGAGHAIYKQVVGVVGGEGHVLGLHVQVLGLHVLRHVHCLHVLVALVGRVALVALVTGGGCWAGTHDEVLARTRYVRVRVL